MKIRKMVTKLAVLALVLVLALVAIVAFAYSRYIPMGRIMPGIYAIRNYNNGVPFVNFFLVRAGEKYIAFDAGSDSEQSQRALRDLGISASDVVAVFITHSDYDHIGSLDLFYNATLYTGITEFQYARRVHGLNLSDFELPDMPHHIMTDRETIEIYGRLIQIIYTPGHTSDSVSFLVDSRYLFVGDLFVNPNFAYYDTGLQIYFQEYVLGMNSVEYVFTGHFGLFRNVGFFRWWWL
ncbi:MAG: MBL fold metallo-hydrolase [Defluviitaleaceae bacterium]|nr:MBL fold metallo-hydrolase [Defluviitaleaceae bacterium]